MAREGHYHILGTVAAHRQGSAIVLGGHGREGHNHVLANRRIGIADGNRLNGKHAIGIVDGDIHITSQRLSHHLERMTAAGAHHHTAKVDFLR